VLILKGFAVYAEAVVVVEVDGVCISVWSRLRRGWAGPRRVVGLGGWQNRTNGLGCGNGMGGGRGKSRFLAALGMTIHWDFGGL